MNVLMWVGIAAAGFFGGLGLRGGVTSDDAGAAKCYRAAAAGAVLASAVFVYQYFGTITQ